MSQRRVFLLLRRNKMFWLCLSLALATSMLAVVGPLITPYRPMQVLPVRAQPPSIDHPFGVDNLGYDVFSATVYGLRVSLAVGLIAATIATLIGVMLGVVAGYFGGLLDYITDGLATFLLTIPSAFILIIIGAFYAAGEGGAGLGGDLPRIAFLGVAVGVLSWHWTARAVRSQVAALKVSDYVYVSRLSGNSSLRIIVKDILPNIGSYAVLVFVIQLANSLSTVVTLEFLGIKASEWSLFARVMQWLQMGALISGVWWAWLLPGVVIVTLITSLYLLVYSLEEVFNPRLAKW